MISLCHAASADLRGDAVDKLRFVCAKGGADVADEIDRLLDDADVSDAAAEALASIDAPCARVLDVLARAFESPEATVRVRAACGLLGTGRLDDAVVRARLEEAARDESILVRVLAVQRLGALPSDLRRPSIPVIVAAVDDPDRNVAMTAIRALGEIGAEAHDAGPAVTRRLEGASEKDKAEITTVLRRLGSPGAVAHLIEELRSPDRETRFRAADELAELGPVGREAIPALIAALEDPDDKVRQSVTYALGDVGPGDPRVREFLLRCLRDPGEYVVTAAATRLGRGFAGDAGVRDALLAALRDPKCKVPGNIAQALVPFGESVAPALVEALRQDGQAEGAGWGAIAGALRKLGLDAAPALRAGISSKDPTVRATTLGLYAELEPPVEDLLPLCESALADESPDVRTAAAEALGELGPKAARVLPRLRAALADKSLPTRTRVAAAIWHVSRESSGLVEPLVAALEDEDALFAAAGALAEMGAAAEPAAVPIARILERTEVSPYVRDAVVPVLRALGPAAKPAVKGLVVALHGRSWCAEEDYDPTPAIEALGAIGPAASAALDALRALRNESRRLAPVIDAAIAKIEPPK